MRSASAEFKRKMNGGGSFYQTGLIVFADGTERDLNAEDFYISGNSFTDGPGTTAFPLGEAIAKKVSISLVNDDDRFSEYDFFGARISVHLNCDLSGTTESLLIGTFTVIEPEAYGTKVDLVATDDMYKADTDYSTSISFPASIGTILADSCETLSIPLLSTRFTNDSFVVAEKPEGITHRQLWGMIAMIAGGNARMDERNRLEIVEYDFSYFETKQDLDGGSFKFTDGANVDGGNFTDYSSGANVDGGDFAELNNFHYFHKIKTPTIATDDVVITGIQTEIDGQVYQNGEEGYLLKVENSLIEGNPEQALELIGARIIGLKFRPFSIDHASYPLAEFGDICYVSDRKGNVYQSVVTDVEFTYWGYTSIKCSADNPLRNSSKYTSGKTQAIIEARKETQKKLGAYDLQVQQLTNLMSQSFGVFKTEEKKADGSIVFYMHDKPEMSNSKTIWKMTADAFAVSTDGGKTWNSGMDSEGNALVNVLSAIGINFDWAKGGTLTLGGKDNVDGKLEVYDADGNLVGSWSKDGAVIQGTIQSSKFVAKGKVTRYAKDYTEDDKEKIKRIILGYTAPTLEDFEKYDFDGDASIAFSDYMTCSRLVSGYIDSVTVDTSITINPENAFGLIKTLGVLISNNGIFSKSINARTLQIGGAEEGSGLFGFRTYVDEETGEETGVYSEGISGEYEFLGCEMRVSSGVVTDLQNSFWCGENENGTYYRFDNGILKCTKKVPISADCSTAWGALFDSPEISLGNWAFNFADVPNVTATFVSTDGMAFMEGVCGTSETSVGSTYLCRPTSYTVTGEIHVTGIGRWK